MGDGMKTIQQIDDARGVLAKRVKEPGLSKDQRILLAGMLNALVWAADGEASATVDRVLAGEAFDKGKTADDSILASSIFRRWSR